jgi:hypothetical protein
MNTEFDQHPLSSQEAPKIEPPKPVTQDAIVQTSLKPKAAYEVQKAAEYEYAPLFDPVLRDQDSILTQSKKNTYVPKKS